MKISPQIVRKKLDKSIEVLLANSRLFVRDPLRDFTRKRAFTIKSIVEILLHMGGNSLNKELLDYFDFSIDAASSSAFIQQRDKLLSEGIGFLLHDFTNSFEDLKTYNGYRLIAVDGTGCNIPKNSKHPTTYNIKKDMNEVYAVAFYDICNHIYTDIDIKGIKEKNEQKSSVHMINRSCINDTVLLLGDRGFSHYNNIANLEEKGWKYLLRANDISLKSSKLSPFGLPVDEEFDVDKQVNLCRSQSKKYKAIENHRFLPKNTRFDFLPVGSKDVYPINFRVVSIKIESGKYAYFITNLSRKEFDKKAIERLYKERWSIETSFRDLKYTLGLINFHSKKLNSIKQEIYSKLIMYNFSQFIIQNIEISTKNTKHQYQINIKKAIYICQKNFRKLLNKHPPEIEKLIRKFILPKRNNRHYPRKVKTRSRINLMYRIA